MEDLKVLQLVFGYLPRKELLGSVRLVSSRWRKAVLSGVVHMSAKLIISEDQMTRFLKWVKKYCENIKKLDFYKCSQSFSDEHFAQLPVQVTDVYLFWCMQITDTGLSSITLPLRHLDLSRTHVSDKGIKHLVALDHIASNLTHLTLEGCMNISDKTLEYLGGCKKLEYLNLTSCHSITDHGIMTNMQQKSKISATGTKVQKDDSLMFKNLYPHLKYICLDNNRRLTDLSIISTIEADVIAHLPSSLEAISLIRCVQVPFSAIARLKEKRIFPKLTNIHYENVKLSYKLDGLKESEHRFSIINLTKS